MFTMRKVLFGFLAFSLLALSVQAQDDPAKALKAANRAFSAFKVDSGNTGKLNEAKEQIDIAIAGEEQKMDPKVWTTRAEIYNALVAKEINLLFFDPSHVLPAECGPYTSEAYSSAKKGLELATKGFQRKDALTQMTESGRYFSMIGNQILQSGDYAAAYQSMKLFLEIDQELRANNEEALILKDEDLANQKFITAFCAYSAGDMPVAKGLFSQLVADGHDEPLSYSLLFNIMIQEENTKEEEALAILEAAKAKFPGNTEILIAEINYFLQEGRLDELVGKLKLAIEKEPDNLSLYTTLGGVFDQLFQRELEAGNEAKGTEYFNEAMKYFNQALEKDPVLTDALYSVGALYYNKAASISKELKLLEEDISRDGLRKYDARKKDMFSYFDQALPYFEKVEALNPNDQNTLIALKEIFARKDDIQLSNEFKSRLEKVQGGGENTESYFKQ
jgi:tetratricopeptide (TPR) repeat protein